MHQTANGTADEIYVPFCDAIEDKSQSKRCVIKDLSANRTEIRKSTNKHSFYTIVVVFV